MEKIKVLHIIKSLGRGGAEMLLPETLKLHNQEVFELNYIYFLPWKNQMVEAIEQAGGKVTCLSAKNNLQLLLKFKEIKKYCKQNQIQLIHAHLPWAGFVSRLVHGITRIPVLYTEHNMQERYHVLTKLINKCTFNSQTLGVGVSQDVTDSILKNIKPNIPVQTLLNGVNTNSFQRNTQDDNIRTELGIPQSAVVVCVVAVFRSQKIPAVAVNVGGVQEVVIDGKTGFLLSDFSPAAFADKVLHLLHNNKLRSQMGYRAYEVVQKKYDSETNSKLFEKFIII